MTAKKSWRDAIAVHPAADLFPMMSSEELRALGEDIRAHGLRHPIVVTLNSALLSNEPSDYSLLDGRNRLDAMELVGIQFELEFCRRKRKAWGKWILGQPEDAEHLIDHGLDETVRQESDADPYDYVLSANVHRRHLTNEQKRELIAKVIKAKPELSDRQIGTKTGTDHKTVAKVRTQTEGRGEIPHVETRTDTAGRQQPASKARAGTSSEEWTMSNDSKVCPSTSGEPRSWGMLAITEDGKRWSDGVRFRTRPEACHYLTNFRPQLGDLALTELRAFESDDEPSGAGFPLDRKGRMLKKLLFEHGTCGTLKWRLLDTKDYDIADRCLRLVEQMNVEERRRFSAALYKEKYLSGGAA
jgi:ParB-like nuclease domain